MEHNLTKNEIEARYNFATHAEMPNAATMNEVLKMYNDERNGHYSLPLYRYLEKLFSLGGVLAVTERKNGPLQAAVGMIEHRDGDTKALEFNLILQNNESVKSRDADSKTLQTRFIEYLMADHADYPLA